MNVPVKVASSLIITKTLSFLISSEHLALLNPFSLFFHLAFHRWMYVFECLLNTRHCTGCWGPNRAHGISSLSASLLAVPSLFLSHWSRITVAGLFSSICSIDIRVLLLQRFIHSPLLDPYAFLVISLTLSLQLLLICEWLYLYISSL